MTKLVPELKDLDYSERLKRLDLPSLMYRRRRGDLIEAFKIRKGLYNINKEKLLPQKEYDKTRHHSEKLEKTRFHLDIRRKFFANRIHDVWNAVPGRLIDAPSLEAFKGRLDDHLQSLRYSTEYVLPSRDA